MTPFLIETLAHMRLLVGFLGERTDPPWWASNFFGPGNHAFLTPLFPRTLALGRGLGVSRAAALLHDERIGVGNVYHLFRLPEAQERALHQALQDPHLTLLQEPFDDEQDALTALHQATTIPDRFGLGPTRIGSLDDLSSIECWNHVAAQYAHAFDHRVQVFPYFTGSAR